MDTDQLISHGRARFEHAAAKRLLKEKYEGKMLFAYAGGMWRADPALLSVLAVCDDGEAVLLDLYETPIKIDVKELQTLAKQRWQEQMNAWLVEHAQLQQQR